MDKTKEENKPKTREYRIFNDMPVWKALLIMALPAMVMMLIFGLYTFMDNVLSINLANDAYSDKGIISTKDQVRLFMSGVTPITTFMFAITMLFGVGLSRRYSINIGAKKEERAISTVKTTMQISLVLSIILIPVLLFSAKPWMRSQFDGNPAMADLIADKAYDYVWIIIISLPLQMFNQIIASLFRAEAKNRQALIAIVLPIGVNLLLDWVFMGPGGMGIEGGAWATAASYVITTALLVFYMLYIKETRIKFKNLFGWNGFRLITVVGVILVGIAPFLRNMAQSITQTVEMREIQNVSQAVYGNNMQMSVIMTAVFPVFGLFFPIMFGFIQAGSPISAYNYGAGNLKRVKQTTMLIALYSTIVGILIYLISAYALMGPLNHLLGISDKDYSITQLSSATAADKAAITKLKSSFVSQGYNFTTVNMPHGLGQIFVIKGHHFHTLNKAQNMYRIMMFSAIFFGPALGAMSLSGTTDRILLNIFSSSLRGVILLMPFLFGFSHLAQSIDYDIVKNNLGTENMFSKEFTFWWFYPLLAATTSITLWGTAMYVMKRLDKKHTTLEARLEKLHAWTKARGVKKKIAKK